MEKAGTVTEINGIDALKLCNNISRSGDGPEASKDDNYKFAEVKFEDKDGKEGKLEFYSLPCDGLWSIEYDGQKIGDATTWPTILNEKNIPGAAASFCTQFFGYKFDVSKDLKEFGAIVSDAVARVVDDVALKASGMSDYKKDKMQHYQTEYNHAKNIEDLDALIQDKAETIQNWLDTNDSLSPEDFKKSQQALDDMAKAFSQIDLQSNEITDRLDRAIDGGMTDGEKEQVVKAIDALRVLVHDTTHEKAVGQSLDD